MWLVGWLIGWVIVRMFAGRSVGWWVGLALSLVFWYCHDFACMDGWVVSWLVGLLLGSWLGRLVRDHYVAHVSLICAMASLCGWLFGWLVGGTWGVLGMNLFDITSCAFIYTLRTGCFCF